MVRIRRASDRGHADHGWLNTFHTFSFADYHDPAQMGFRSLRVMNEDRVQPGMGFGAHSHRDMEIVTYVLEGALEHRDSMGHGAVLRPGELQRITAGTGMFHSEFNPGDRDPVHFYQIWIVPEKRGLPPSWEQRGFDAAEKRGRLRLVASPDGRDGSLSIRSDAKVYLADLHPGEEVRPEIAPGRHVWLQVLRGRVRAEGESLSAGDGLAASEKATMVIRGEENAEVMLFDLS